MGLSAILNPSSLLCVGRSSLFTEILSEMILHCKSLPGADSSSFFLTQHNGQ